MDCEPTDEDEYQEENQRGEEVEDEPNKEETNGLLSEEHACGAYC